MNIRTVFIRAALAAAFLGSCVVLSHAPHALAAQDAATMTVDARAPLHASLLPAVAVVAGADAGAGAQVRVAAGEALAVTLLPTVHVTARASAFATAAPRDPVDTRIAAID